MWGFHCTGVDQVNRDINNLSCTVTTSDKTQIIITNEIKIKHKKLNRYLEIKIKLTTQSSGIKAEIM